MNASGTTRDRFLGGRIVADQPKRGFRAGHDTVLLAAAVPGQPGHKMLELGCGAGIASLCLAVRVPGIGILGIDIDSGLVAIANINAALNALSDRVRFETADAATFASAARVDHVFFNPPFHSGAGTASPDPARDRARRDTAQAVAGWTRTALALVRDGGTVTAVLPALRIEEILLEAQACEATIFPLFPRAGESPKRAILRLTKGGRGRRDLKGLVLHEADGRNTQSAEAVLRHGAALELG